jgi:hypothetical protein
MEMTASVPGSWKTANGTGKMGLHLSATAKSIKPKPFILIQELL